MTVKKLVRVEIRPSLVVQDPEIIGLDSEDHIRLARRQVRIA